MDRVFNMGVGMIVVCDSTDVAVVTAAASAEGIDAWTIGRIEEGAGVQYR